MPQIYVRFTNLEQIGSQCKTLSDKVSSVQSEMERTIQKLDWDVRYSSDINRSANKIAKKLKSYSDALKAYQKFIINTQKEYVKLDEYKELNLSISDIAKDKPGILATIAKSYITDAIIKKISPVASLLYKTSGIYTGELPTMVNDTPQTESRDFKIEGPGYNISDGTKITAWISKQTDIKQGNWVSSDNTLYKGKFEAESKATIAVKSDKDVIELIKDNNQDDAKDKKESLIQQLINAEMGSSASISGISGDSKYLMGNDMLGLEVGVKADVLTGKAEGKVTGTIDANGIDAYGSGALMVAVADTEISCTLKFLGIDIGVSENSILGGLGVKGKYVISKTDGINVKAATGLGALGGGVGFSVKLNDTGMANLTNFYNNDNNSNEK